MGVCACVCLVVLVVVARGRVGQTFNVLPEGVSDFSGPAASDFGFSVALWKDITGVKRVVVGAPRGKQIWANFTFPLGVVYLCAAHLGTADDDDGGGDNGGGGGGGGECDVMPDLTLRNYDRIKNNLLRTYNYTLTHYGIAMGQTVAAEKGNGTRMTVCSPRYPTSYRENLVTNDGLCFVMEEPTSFTSFRPPNNQASRNSLYGFSVTSIENNLVVGAPTGYLECGMVLNCVLRRCPYMNRFMNRREDMYKVVRCYSSYEGWAVQAGRFAGSSSPLTIAASALHANDYKGQISFYRLQVSPEDTPLHVIKGREFGALFGYALAAPDIDGDGAADLVISAPFASSTPNKLYDVGKVFIHYAPLADSGSHQPEQVLLGRDNMGRFGTSVTSLGDINGDTYHDVAIGAPYAGKDGSGLVYIYNGGRDGLVHTNPMVIAPSEFLPGARGFGFSLDGDLDMDDNGYPDMVIGAVHSNSAVLLRASPVLRLIGSVTFNPSPIDIKTMVCEIEQPGQNKMRGVCSSVRVDLQYTSKTTFSHLELEYELKMYVSSNSSIMYGFLPNADTKTRVVRNSYKDRRMPWTLSTFVQRSRDILDLDVLVTVAVVRVAFFEPFGLPPILDPLTPTSFHTSSKLVCEDKSGCFTEPDLVLNAFGSPVIMVDVPVRIHLNVSVEVRRDPAYGIKVHVIYPDHITYKYVDARGIIPQCMKTMPGRSEIQCYLEEGDAYEQIDFWLTFEHSKEEEEDLLLQGTAFSLSVSNDQRNSDPDPSNNHARVTIPTITKATLYPHNISEPEMTSVVVIQTASQEEIEAAKTTTATFPVDRLGPRFDHSFILNNRGPSPVQDAMLLFHIPLYLGEAPLTYFMAQPVTSPGVICDPVPINPLGLQLPRQPVTHSFFAYIMSLSEEKKTTQHWRAKREVEESKSPATTSRSTSVDSSTFSHDSSTFHWTTDQAEYFSKQP